MGLTASVNLIDDLELVYWTIGLLHEYAIKGINLLCFSHLDAV
jgi:hypothetical protein